jgi:rubrerythrin
MVTTVNTSWKIILLLSVVSIQCPASHIENSQAPATKVSHKQEHSEKRSQSMDNVVKSLTNLYKHNLAAVEVYKDIIKSISTQDIKKKLQDFLDEHEKNLRELAELIQSHKGEMPSDWRDLKGVLLEAYTTLRSLTGESGALKALKTCEGVVLKEYESALKEEYDDDAKNLVKRHCDREREHNSYLDSINK